MLDLVILIADKNMEFALRGLLTRHEPVGFHPLPDANVEILRHPRHDPGCRLRGHELLREYVGKSSHALMLFDREGCGREDSSRIELESEAEENLTQSGWGDNAAAIVIDPELDIWIWSGSKHVIQTLGWDGLEPNLQKWLKDEGFTDSEDQLKPKNPKEALERALRIARKPRSSAIYKALAEKVSLAFCQDPAFIKFTETMKLWFPPEKHR